MKTVPYRCPLQGVEATCPTRAESPCMPTPPLHPKSLCLRQSIIQQGRGGPLGRHSLTSRTAVPPSILRMPYSLRHALTPSLLNLLRWENPLFAAALQRAPRLGLTGYLLEAVGVEVSLEPLLFPPLDLHCDAPGKLLQIVSVCDVKTRAVFRAHICPRRAVYGWLLGVVEAKPNQRTSPGPTGRYGNTRSSDSRDRDSLPSATPLAGDDGHGLNTHASHHRDDTVAPSSPDGVVALNNDV